MTMPEKKISLKEVEGKYTRCTKCDYTWKVKGDKLPNKCPWCNKTIETEKLSFTDGKTDWKNILGD